MSSPTYDPTELLRIKKLKELIALIPRILKLIWEVSPSMVICIGLMALVTATVQPATLFLTKVIVDRVVDSQDSTFIWAFFLVPIGVIFSLWIGSSLLQGLEGLIQELLFERTGNATATRLMRKAASLDIAFFEAPKFYDQLKQAEENQWRVQDVPLMLFSTLQQLFSLTAMIGLLSILHPLAFLLLLATVLPRFLLQGHMMRLNFRLDTELMRNWRQTRYMESVLMKREKAKEVRIFGLDSMFLNRFLGLREDYIARYKTLMLKFVTYYLSMDTLSTVGVTLVSIFAVVQAIQGEITVGTLTMVFGAAQQIVDLIGSLVGTFTQLYRGSLDTSRFFELLDINPKTIEGSLDTSHKASPVPIPSRIRKGIELRNISFGYPGNPDKVLNDVSFSIPVGSKVAIVGENGAGKTTLVKLMARFYDPERGSIKLDGIDYREFAVEDLRKRFGIVFQDFVRYDISAAQNIGVGNIGLMNDRDRIQVAAQNSGAHAVIANLPMGYDTVLGRTMDEGVDLSGGEWQHISIARAFMSEAPILILDEPTAALDSLRERELYDNIARLSVDRTVVFISHRFSTVRMADLIVVIDGGRSIEMGSHEELIKQGGKYRSMFETQAERYR